MTSCWSVLVLGFIYNLLPIKPLSYLYYIYQASGWCTVAQLRKIEKLQRKYTSLKCDINFLTTCVQLDIIPQHLRFKQLRHQPDSMRILLQHTIDDYNCRCSSIEKNVRQLLQVLRSKFTLISWMKYVKSMHSTLQYVKNKKMKVLDAKLRILRLKQQPPYYDSLINLTDVMLTTTQENILRLGLKQPWFPNKINVIDQQSIFERLYFHICNSTKDSDIDLSTVVKPHLLHLFHQYKVLQQHATRKLNQQFSCLRSLTKNKEIKVVDMDKGNGTVIMTSHDYNEKLLQILADESKFQLLCINPTADNHPIVQYENRLQRIVRRIVKPQVDTRIYHNIYPQGGMPGKLYGTAKVHKASIPLRPVVSMINTPQYDLSKYLDNVLRPYLQNQHTVSSAFQLTEKLKTLTLTDTTDIVSFDVCNLFTNVPLSYTIDIICDKVCTSSNSNGFPYTAAELRTLLKIANETYFDFNGSIYKQKDGISMGNPLAPLLADFFMGHFEQCLFSTPQAFYPQQYFRYVDDTLCLFKSSEHVEQFLNHINNFHENIRFTLEKSTNNSIPFLDIKVSLDNGEITTEVYRKPTFTGRLLHFRSVVPKVWKTGLIKCLIHRAFHLSSNWHVFHNEVTRLYDILTFNGYPRWWLERTLKNFLNTNLGHNDATETRNDDRNYTVVKLPYYGQCSLSLKRNLNKLLRKVHNQKIKVVFTIQRLRCIFPLKQKEVMPIQSSIVYKFRCLGDPSISYIGETARQLIRRIRDHTSTNTAINSHLHQCSFCPRDIGGIIAQFKVIQKGSTDFDREIKEALLIRQHQPPLNVKHNRGKLSYTLALF